MGKLVDDKRKALLKARLEKEKEGIVIEETKPKKNDNRYSNRYVLLIRIKRVGLRPTSAFLFAKGKRFLFCKIKF